MLQLEKKLIGMQDNMMTFAMSLTSNREDAQDLLQDTTLRVLDNQEKYTDNVNFKGWVMTVMRNTFINQYHRIIRSQTIIDQCADLYHMEIMNDSGFDSPDVSFHLKEITKAIDALEDDLHNPFSLYLSGYKYAEIAETLDVPIGTVKSRIFLARLELQKALVDFKKH
ncbi:RNA polymerase sigma factor (sigma-70 family) [Parabacteroides sp. PF5-9]|nr:RNA polymerase sigma factor (sigma-70 family) [Parabacteroides sp. PF5-9]